MPPIPDPYRVLGVAREATVGEIRTAHRRLAKQYHPDATEGDTERFLAVQEAYQVLSDPLRRREWDARHRPGPVRADASPRARPATGRGGAARSASTARGQAQASPPGDTGTTGSGPRGARGPRTQTNRQRRRPEPFSASGREPTSDSYTWSAQDVPWWSSGPDRAAGAGRTSGAGAAPATGTTAAADDRTSTQAGPPAGASPPPAPSGADFDVYNRSSGAAWSMASRAYFRRAGSDVPRGAAEPFGQRWTTPPGQPSKGPGPGTAATTPPPARPAAGWSSGAGTRAAAGAPSPGAAGARARGVVFGPPGGSAFERGGQRALAWPSVGGRLLYAVLGWLAPAAALVLGPFVVAVPVTTGLLSAIAVALLLAPRAAYLAAVGGTAALVAGTGLALGQAASGDQLGLGFDALVAAVVTVVYGGAIVLACLDWPIPRPWSARP